MKIRAQSLAIVFILLFSGCVSNQGTNIEIKSPKVNAKEFSNSISTLPRMEVNTVKNFEQFQEFADNTNALIRILNREGKLQIPEIEKSTQSWEKISKVIVEWTPLIGNYNAVIDAAKGYDESDKNSKEKFYTAIGIFGLETTIILATSFYSISFETVGFLFRSSGVTEIAFYCPTCVSVILSSAHWFIRNSLVEEASKTITPYFEILVNNWVK